ncbi:helix-turn-helix transcriptional regulator [Oscillospiraceae bacterium HV4-5-C5C]|nr:helix-turn-helix transcriptional regulator [Oscillospiraceae bacterium HV4-5-C5C]
MKKQNLTKAALPCPVWMKQVGFGAELQMLSFVVPAYLIPLKGQAVLRAGNRRYRALPGRVLRLDSGLELTLTVGSDSFWYVVALTQSKADSRFRQQKADSRTRLFTAAAQPALLARALPEINRSCGLSSCPFCKGANPLIATTIWQALESGKLSLLERLTAPDLERPLKLIHQRYHEPLSLEELARPCQMSSSAFSYCFHKEMGIRPSAYLIRHRLSCAAQKLRQGHTVAQSAYSAGYEDPFYFSRLFKRYFGVAPDRWKRGLL